MAFQCIGGLHYRQGNVARWAHSDTHVDIPILLERFP